MQPKSPICFGLSIVSAFLLLPLLKLLDRLATGGGDGYQNLGAGLLIIAGCLLGMVIFAVAGWLRGEAPRWLIFIALLALVAPMPLLMF